MSNESNEEQAKYWIELRKCWEDWRRGIDTPLSPDASVYFGDLAHRYFCAHITAYRPGEAFPKPPDGSVSEAWEQVKNYFGSKRPRSTAFLFDDIFTRAFLRAGEIFRVEPETLSLPDVIGCLRNQFKMRTRDLVRKLYPETGTNNPLNDETNQGRELPHTGVIDQNDLADFGVVVSKIVDKFEAEAKPRAKIGVFLSHYRINLGRVEVTNCLGVKKAALYEEVSQARKELGHRVETLFRSDGLGTLETEVGRALADDEFYLRCRDFFAERHCGGAHQNCAGLVTIVKERVPTLCDERK